MLKIAIIGCDMLGCQHAKSIVQLNTYRGVNSLMAHFGAYLVNW